MKSRQIPCGTSILVESVSLWARRTCASLAVLFMLAAAASGQDGLAAPERLTVATREVPPFAMRNADGQWIGISIELLREIKADLEAVSGHDIKVEFRELSLEDMLAAVEQSEVDLAAAALTVNYDREKRMDFTHPFHSSGLGIAVGRKELRTWDAVLMAVFSVSFFKLLGALFVALLVSGVAVYFFERRRNPEQFGGGVVKGIGSGIWWAAVTVTTVGYGDKAPKTAAGRMVAFVWMFAGLFIIASFTAAVTSSLTVNRLQSRIAGPSDLPRIRVATVADSTSEDYLRRRHIVAGKHANLMGALLALRNGEVDAAVYDAAILRHEVHQHFSGELHVLPATFERQDYAFALPTESPLRERMSQVVLRKIGSPEWNEVLAGYLGERFE